MKLLWDVQKINWEVRTERSSYTAITFYSNPTEREKSLKICITHMKIFSPRRYETLRSRPWDVKRYIDLTHGMAFLIKCKLEQEEKFIKFGQP